MNQPTDPVSLHAADGIAVITLNRPERLNAFNRDLCLALNDAVASVSEDDSVRVVILTGAGKAFSSGADLKEGISAETSLQQRLNEEFRPAITGIMEMGKPVIAAINGPVAGIGAAYVLAADLAVMAEDAYMMQPFVNISLVPDGGITWHLAREMGHKRAYEFIISGQRLDAKRCEALGLVNRVVPSGQALQAAKEYARQLLQLAPLALRHSKAALRHSAENGFASAFDREGELQEICGASEDCQEGIKAFVEKRTANFRGY